MNNDQLDREYELFLDEQTTNDISSLKEWNFIFDKITDKAQQRGFYSEKEFRILHKLASMKFCCHLSSDEINENIIGDKLCEVCKNKINYKEHQCGMRCIGTVRGCVCQNCFNEYSDEAFD